MSAFLRLRQGRSKSFLPKTRSRNPTQN